VVDRNRKLDRRRGGDLACAALALAFVVAGGFAPSAIAEEVKTGDDVVASLLAVGDTGKRLALSWLREGQRSVARGMAAEDRRRPVDALVLLGDLFYPRGIETGELALRVRENLVLPYCRFADLAGPRSHEVAGACDEPEARRHPVPIFAVPGNHDYGSPESPDLERRGIPEFLPNWHMQEGVAVNVELGQGLSLVLVDTPALARGGDFAAVREALRRAQGPWRIVAAHLPVAPGDAKADLEWRSAAPPIEHFSLPEAPVHLYLAGHRHNLQVIEGRAPGPRLHVIAGSGATIRPVRSHYADRRFALEQTGFARVDLVGRGEDQRLVVSLFSVPRLPIVFWAEPRLVSRWSVDRSGGVRREPLSLQPDQPKSRASTSSRVQTR
jgi:hypothetical protein